MSVSSETVLFSWSIVIGFLPELLFQLQKNKSLESLLNVPFSRYREFVSTYFVFDEFVYDPRSLLGRYIIFRFLPPIVAFVLLQSIQAAYFSDIASLKFLLISAAMSVVFRDVLFLFRTNRLQRERILHVLVIMVILALATVIWAIGGIVNFAFLVPHPEEVVQGAWSTLLGASIVALYISVLREPQAGSIYENRSERAKRAFVIAEYQTLSSRYGQTFASASEKFECSLALLYSIAIYEGMNRPRLVRVLENTLVRVPGLKLTVGIMQIESRHPLTDEDSITQAAAMLCGTDSSGDSAELWEAPRTIDAVGRYNRGSSYVDQLRYVTGVLDGVPEVWHNCSASCLSGEQPSDERASIGSLLKGLVLRALGRTSESPMW